MFDYLDEYQVTGTKTARIRLRHIKGVEGRTPVLICLPFTHHNAGVLNAAVRAAGEGLREGETISQEALASTARRNAERIASLCVKGWEDIKGNDGGPVTYTPDLALKFLLYLAEKVDYQLTDLIEDLKDLTNFTNGAVSSAEQTAKNVERG
jgi:hypothetical protein